MSNTNRVVSLIYNVPMAYSHRGLKELAMKTLKLNLDDLKVGEFVLFVNKPYNAFKLFATGNTFVYHREPNPNALLSPDVLKMIPTFFVGTSIRIPTDISAQVEKACKQAIERSATKVKSARLLDDIRAMKSQRKSG